MPTGERRGSRPARVVVLVGLGVAVIVVLIFAARRFALDVPHLRAETIPDDDFDRRYVLNPWVTGIHISLGAAYLIGAIHQLTGPLRRTRPAWHRRIGRITAVCGLTSALLGAVLGVLMPYGGVLETAASLTFGPWMGACLVLGVRAIRRGDVVTHARWMIRAFAVGAAVGSIRLWVGALSGTGLLAMEEAFGVAFWLAFALHAAAAEWWLRRTDEPATTEGRTVAAAGREP